MLVNENIKQLGISMLKFSFQDMIKKINGLIDAEHMLRVGKSRLRELGSHLWIWLTMGL